MNEKKPEVFCSLIDSVFLPQLLCMYASLRDTAGQFRLFVVCIDEDAERSLTALALPFLTIVPVTELESSRLLAVKAQRTALEYCWTLTPFIFDRVFELSPEAARVTYLDADMMFFSDPAVLFAELDKSGKDVLVTEHAYDPEYDQSATSGRFCVQLVTFSRSKAARKVREWWQDRCVEWCFDRIEDGRFGDQKYLDAWPSLFGDSVHVLHRRELALSPWNVRMFERANGNLAPVFFHFHGLRLVSSHWLRLWWGYRIGREGKKFYRLYSKLYRRQRATLAGIGFELKPSAVMQGGIDILRAVRNLALRKASFVRV